MADQEIEIKLQIPPSQLASLEKRVGTASSRRTRLQAVYFDSDDGQLRAAGVAVRLRREGRQWVQTLKVAQTGALLERLEHNVARPGHNEPVLDLGLHQGSPAGLALHALMGSGLPELKVIFRTDIQRLHRPWRLRGGSVELALDQGEIQSGPLRWPVCELEIEHLSGDASVVMDAAQAFIERFGVWIDTRTKSDRGHRLWQARIGHAVDPARPMRGRAVSAQSGLRDAAVPLDASAADACPVGRGLHWALLSPLIGPLLANASEMAAGTDDAEHLHQVRVSIRRIRSVARLVDRWLPPWPEAVMHTLVEVFRVLGQQRDRHVVMEEYSAPLSAAGAPLVRLPESPTAPSIDTTQALMQSTRVNLAWIWLLRASGMDASDVHVDAARQLINERLERWASEIDQSGRQFERLSEPQRHDLRKRVKRLRYALDSCAALQADGIAIPRREYTQALSEVQAMLGQFCDLLIARDLWRQACDIDARAWFAVGWFSAEISRMEPDARRALKRLAKHERRWRS